MPDPGTMLIGGAGMNARPHAGVFNLLFSRGKPAEAAREPKYAAEGRAELDTIIAEQQRQRPRAAPALMQWPET